MIIRFLTIMHPGDFSFYTINFSDIFAWLPPAHT